MGGNDPKQGEVILAFGAPRKIDSNTYGATLFVNGAYSTATIRSLAQQFAKGFYDCLNAANKSDPTVRWFVALGTSNLYPSSMTRADVIAHGSAWSQMVVNGQNWLVNNGYSGKVSFRGAIDAELGWSGPGKVRDWINGYDDVAGWRPYINFGDAAGCQTFDTGSPSSCGTSSYPEWTSQDVHYISWWAAPALSLPQIYRTDGVNAEQWVMISRWGINNFGPSARIGFEGPLTQSDACAQRGGCSGTDNTPAQAWNQMVDKMDRRSDTITDMTYSTDIRWVIV